MSKHHLNQKRKGCKTSTMHSKWVKPWNHLPSPETNSLLAPETSLIQKGEISSSNHWFSGEKPREISRDFLPTIEDLGLTKKVPTKPRFRGFRPSHWWCALTCLQQTGRRSTYQAVQWKPIGLEETPRFRNGVRKVINWAPEHDPFILS